MEVQKNISETVKETYNYYREGKSIEQIAKLRNLKETTIYGHFETLIVNELVNLNEIVDQIKKEKILDVLKKKDLESLREIKDQLDESINYGEIKCVLAFVKLSNATNPNRKRKDTYEDTSTNNTLSSTSNISTNNKKIDHSGMEILTVKELTNYIKNLLGSDSKLCYLFVKGEVSNLTKHSSEHIYFSLKDEETRIRCAFFRRANKNLKFELENGMKIIVRGEIEVYQPRGEYNLIVEEVYPDGMGALHLAFIQLRNKLEKEGLFLSQYKKSIPKFPKNVGVITSITGAALQDILKVIKKRYPLIKVILVPTLVQGNKAANSIVESIELINQLSNIDVVILGRGGSLEDLWSFNEEIVARAIHNSKIPIISAVGHETDSTIADFVADVRAPTPSAAAEVAVPDMKELFEQLIYLNERSSKSLSNKLKLYKSNLDQIRCKFIFKNPLSILNKNYRDLDHLESKIITLNPTSILKRGYSIVMNKNRVLTNSSDVKKGEDINIILHGGKINAEVKKTWKN